VLWDGVVMAPEFLHHVQRLTSDPDWPASRRLHLARLRIISVHPSLDTSILEEAASLYGKHHQKIFDMQVAIVTDSGFVKAVEFERLLSKYGARVIVFNTLDPATLWLGINQGRLTPLWQHLEEQLSPGNLVPQNPQAGLDATER